MFGGLMMVIDYRCALLDDGDLWLAASDRYLAMTDDLWLMIDQSVTTSNHRWLMIYDCDDDRPSRDYDGRRSMIDHRSIDGDERASVIDDNMASNLVHNLRSITDDR